jgi:hypothetical protein
MHASFITLISTLVQSNFLQGNAAPVAAWYLPVVRNYACQKLGCLNVFSRFCCCHVHEPGQGA